MEPLWLFIIVERRGHYETNCDKIYGFFLLNISALPVTNKFITYFAIPIYITKVQEQTNSIRKRKRILVRKKEKEGLSWKF